jgi:hypothetical protein
MKLQFLLIKSILIIFIVVTQESLQKNNRIVNLLKISPLRNSPFYQTNRTPTKNKISSDLFDKVSTTKITEKQNIKETNLEIDNYALRLEKLKTREENINKKSILRKILFEKLGIDMKNLLEGKELNIKKLSKEELNKLKKLDKELNNKSDVFKGLLIQKKIKEAPKKQFSGNNISSFTKIKEKEVLYSKISKTKLKSNILDLKKQNIDSKSNRSLFLKQKNAQKGSNLNRIHFSQVKNLEEIKLTNKGRLLNSNKKENDTSSVKTDQILEEEYEIKQYKILINDDQQLKTLYEKYKKTDSVDRIVQVIDKQTGKIQKYLLINRKVKKEVPQKQNPDVQLQKDAIIKQNDAKKDNKNNTSEISPKSPDKNKPKEQINHAKENKKPDQSPKEVQKKPENIPPSPIEKKVVPSDKTTIELVTNKNSSEKRNSDVNKEVSQILQEVENQNLKNPILINWEIGLVKSYFEKKNQPENFEFIKSVLLKVTSIVQMYISINEHIAKRTRLSTNNYCTIKYVDSNTYDAHLVIFVDISTSGTSVGATGSPCLINPFTGRASVGLMDLNPIYAANPNSSELEKSMFLKIVLHEVLHIIAFNQNPFLTGKGTLVSEKIEQIRDSGLEVFDKGHWNFAFVPMEVMNPVAAHGSILSSLSLNLISKTSFEYTPVYANLPFHPFLDKITDLRILFEYKCEQSENEPKFSTFCSHKQLLNNKKRCSFDFLSKTYCYTEKLQNGCYQKIPYPDDHCQKETVDFHSSIETRSMNSRCFETNDDAYCLKVEIEEESLYFFANSEKYKCSHKNEKIAINKKDDFGRTIEVTCPDIDHFIQIKKETDCPFLCHNNGFCSNGKCICFPGFDKNDDCKSKNKIQHSETVFFEDTLNKIERVK